MKPAFLILAICFVVFGAVANVTPTIAHVNQFTGLWVNTDPNTGGITRLEIATSGSSVSVHAWGKFTPQDCDWGQVTGTLYASSVGENLPQNARALTAIFNTSFNQTILVMHPARSEQLQVETLARFTDNSGRSHYNSVYTFARSSAPNLISPTCGSVFSHFPRRTTLHWSDVPSATSYTVEIDCYHRCQANKWCTDVGRTWKVVSDLTTTSYTFNFVGAQPGRWRVWAVFSNGSQGEKTPWCEFSYTQ